MLENLNIETLKKIRWVYYLLLFFGMPKLFSMLFYSKDATGIFHYFFNDWELFFKFLIIGVLFVFCKIGLGNFLGYNKFSILEKILIIIAFPLIEFLTLSSFSALKGVDILLMSTSVTSFKISLITLFYCIAVYFMLYLNYKTDQLNIDPMLEKIFKFLRVQHIVFKNYFWLKKAP